MSKKDGTVRLCVNYRKLNAATRSDAFPTTNAQELLYKVGHAQFITEKDLQRKMSIHFPFDALRTRYGIYYLVIYFKIL